MARYDVHLIPEGDEWLVLREGDATPVSRHAARDEAERAGRQLAVDGDVAFVTHSSERREDPGNDDPRRGD